MSTSSTYVKWAAVTLDFDIFSKIRFRRPRMGIRCSLPLGAAAADGGGVTTVVLVGPCAALRTSSSVRRPCGPLPRTAARLTLSSFARRRTAGAARTSPVGLGAGGASVLVGTGGGALGRVVSGRGGAVSPASPNTTRVLPTFTTSPSFARSWRIFPVTGDGIWTVTLSVMTSTIGSFSLTASPSFTNHLTTSPSWTPSPMSGSLNSRAIFSRSATVASPAADLTFCTLRCPGAYSRCESFYGLLRMRVWAYGLAVLATVVTLVYVGFTAYERSNSGEALSLAAILTLGIVGVIFVYLLAASRAFRRPFGTA